jgi:hypothetical protein
MTYISKKNRELIRLKFNGKCAYTGTDLEDDWQVDHIEPIIRDSRKLGEMFFPQYHCLDNMFPTHRIINNYKRNLSLETFRSWYLGELNLRLKKLPKNPTVKSRIKHKENLLKIAELFGITADKPFSGKFYFETLSTTANEPLSASSAPLR